MIKFLFIIIFMIPIRFYKNFWLNQYLYLLIILIFFINFRFIYIYIYIRYMFGIDLLSYIIIILRLWICFLIILASELIYYKKNFQNFFLLVIILLLLSLYLTFSSINLFIFYLFFEISLIPTLLLIVGWGYQPERLQAGIYLLFYTLLASLPIIIFIFYYYINYNRLIFVNIIKIDNLYLYICIIFVFLVKIPIYFIHLWLPKAHVEAPVSGSIILAGVILKLGGYGLIRLIIIFTLVGISYNFIFITIRMIGGFIVSLICLRQVDIKSLIAYSSVSHIRLVLGGIISINYWGLCGSLVIIVAHGLCSSGLFCLANINYERLIRRRLYLNKGLINILPSLSLWWFLLRSSNMAAPPSLNLLGEIFLINRLISWRFFCIISLSLISFFRAVYSLYLYSYSQHGKTLNRSYSYSIGYIREYLLLILHWLPLNILILKREYFILWLYLNSLSKILVCGTKDIIIVLNNIYLLNFLYFTFKFKNNFFFF